MTRYKTSQEWIDQSRLLIDARPQTTRITTRYSVRDRTKKKSKKKDPESTAAGEAAEADETAAAAATATPRPPRGHLVFKTYDPVSGATLKYRTTKAAEVTHLVKALEQLAQRMAAVRHTPDEAMPDAPVSGSADPAAAAAAVDGTEAGPAAKGETATAKSAQQQKQPAGQGGGKKRKKGKK